MDSSGTGHQEYGTSHHSGASGLDMDVSSDYAASNPSSGFTSIETTAAYYVYENGRRYQNLIEGRYPLPNDEGEQSREEMKQHLANEILGQKLTLAPIGGHPHKILDLGTGCGQWAMEAAIKYPSAHVIAIDLSPIGPYFHPPNLEWRIDDLEAEWPPLYSHADFIHARSLIQTLRNPDKLLSSAYESLQPGGWIEFEDILPRLHCDDASLPSNSALIDFFNLLKGPFADRYHWNLSFPERLPDALQAVGFIRTKVQRVKVPIGGWARDSKSRTMGYFMQVVLEGLVPGVLAKQRELGLSKDEAKTLADQAMTALRDPNIHAYLYWSSIWAQKPS